MSPEDKPSVEEPKKEEVEEASAPAEEVAEEQVEEASAPAEESKMKWYVVHTYSGFENKVKIGVEERFKDSNLEFKLGDTLIKNLIRFTG